MAGHRPAARMNFANLGNGTYLMMSTQVFIVEAQ